MSNLIVITAEMHKVADFYLNVKYRCPGNVVKYTSVEFEIFRDGECFKAIPVETDENRRLTDLPKQLLFQIKNGMAYTSSRTGTEEVVEEIVNKLFEMKIVEVVAKKVVEKSDAHSICISDLSKRFNYKKPIFFTIAEQKFINQCRLKYLEMNQLSEIKDFYEYERQLLKVIKELSQTLFENISSEISGGLRKSVMPV